VVGWFWATGSSGSVCCYVSGRGVGPRALAHQIDCPNSITIIIPIPSRPLRRGQDVPA
jgi:hypothetical protein